jgi:hypothetical protein
VKHAIMAALGYTAAALDFHAARNHHSNWLQVAGGFFIFIATSDTLDAVRGRAR